MSPNNRFFSRFFSRFSTTNNDHHRAHQLVNTEDEINVDDPSEQSIVEEQNLVSQPIIPITTRVHSSSSILKRYERNYISASCSMFAIAALAVSLSDYRWLWLNGGLCNSKYIGLSMFFAVGKLYVVRAPIPWDPSAPMNEIYQFKPNEYMELIGCVDTRSILILRLMITLICLAIFSSTIGFLLDALGPMKFGLKFMRRHAFWHILSVLLCTVVTGLCFWASELIYDIQDRNRSKIGKKVEVQFDIAYYLVVMSSGLSLLASAFALLRRYPTAEEEHLERLMDDWSRREEPLFIERSLPATTSTIPTSDEPPPDYSEQNAIVI
ncbi:unnamed protein product [Rotaria sordida]|uniref:Transmembrane protein 127 transmembrane region domain-containing protein n=2 Tax=Rotaria sordida TaxID=392033 RepID=A0A813NU16_9BILA|nr:unnamed protein product [Rotaria sordida]CAF0807059.1 unnamed protein product [Rotaria sordida]CAF0822667.1 unnamed protein product [Rotaria sordida]